MGVTWVFEAEQTAKSVERLLESLGADIIGTFVVDITPYNPPTANSDYPTNIVMHHSKCPQSTFSICPKESFKKSPKAVCDKGFDLILSKLSNGLIQDNAGKIKINGNEYRLRSDWTIRVGTATQGTAVKGAVVEVEYDPSIIVVQCREMMIEFVQSVFNKYYENQPEIFMITEKPERYTALDTMWQYLLIAAKLRKKT